MPGEMLSSLSLFGSLDLNLDITQLCLCRSPTGIVRSTQASIHNVWTNHQLRSIAHTLGRLESA